VTDQVATESSIELFSTVFNAVESGIVVQDLDGRVLEMNPAAERILGLTLGQMSGVEPLGDRWGLIDEDGVAWPLDDVPALSTLRTGEPVSALVIGVNRQDGSRRWVRTDSRLFHTESGPAGVVSSFVDVTEYKHLHDSLAASEARFATGFDSSPIGMALVSPEGRIMRVNAALGAQAGRGPQALLGEDWTVVVHPDDVERMIEVGLSIDPEVESHRGPVRLLSPDGAVVHAEISVSIIHDPDGQVAHFFVQSVDVTDRVKLAEDLSNQAVHDYLTGVLNRRGFAAAITDQLERTRRYGDGGALLMIDLNDFKSLNDTLGHGAGDQLLTQVAQTLLRRLRSTDVVARLGGDEFAVILPKADSRTAIDTAQALLDELREQSGPFGAASIGIALFEPARSVEEIMTAADRAMYRAKVTRQPRWELELEATQ
jgi:diguanylate cyclase (GGDEF)-like protein/PAS domain S-box-containing protein